MQLGDVSEQVSSVFDAIEDDVAPLQSLLPTPPDQETGGTEDSRPGSSESATRNTPGSGHSSAPSTSDGGTSERGRTDSGRPSESTDTGQENDGLLGGGTGGLLDPPKDSSPASPSTGGNTPPAEPDVTLPPLLPGLLPGLGIEADDAE